MRWAYYLIPMVRPLLDFERREVLSIPGVKLWDKPRQGTVAKGPIPGMLRVPIDAGWLIGAMLDQYKIPYKTPIKKGEPPRDYNMPLEYLAQAGVLKPEWYPKFTDYQHAGFQRAMETCGLLAKWGCGAGKSWLGVSVCAASVVQGERALFVTSAPVKEQMQDEFFKLTTLPHEQVQIIHGLDAFEVIERQRPGPAAWWVSKDVRTVLLWLAFAGGEGATAEHAGYKVAKTWEGLGEKFIEQWRMGSLWTAAGSSTSRVSFAETFRWLRLHLTLDQPLKEVLRALYKRTGLDQEIAEDLEEGPRRAQVREAFIASVNESRTEHLKPYLAWVQNLPMTPWMVRNAVTRQEYGRFTTYEEADAQVTLLYGGPQNRRSEDTLATPPAQCLPPEAKVLIVNWDVLATWAPALQAWGPTSIIFDEIHRCKDHSNRIEEVGTDPKTGRKLWAPKRSQAGAAALLSQKARRVVGLSATPITNYPEDLWAPLDCLRPWDFGGWKLYSERYCARCDGTYGVDTSGKSNEQELFSRLTFILHSVEKSQTHKGLPPLRISVIPVSARDLAQVKEDRGERHRAQERGSGAMREFRLGMAAWAKNPWQVARSMEFLEGEEGEKIVIFHKRVEAARELEGLYRKKFERWSKKKGQPPILHAVYGDYATGSRRDILRQVEKHDGPLVLICMLQSWGESVDGLQHVDRATFLALPDTVREAIQGIGRFDRKGRVKPGGIIVELPVAQGMIDEPIRESVLVKLDNVGSLLQDHEALKLHQDIRGAKSDLEILDEVAGRELEEAESALWSRYSDDDD